MTEAWAYGGGPSATGTGGSVTLIEGTTFCISGRSGDLRSGTPQGLFFRDTRFLSVFNLTVDEQSLEPLATHLLTPYAATFIARRPPRPGTADSTLLVIRNRNVGDGMLEEITVRNLGREQAAFTLTLEVDADFAGLFEVKEDRVQRRRVSQLSAGPAMVRLRYRNVNRSRGVEVTGSVGATARPRSLSWQLVIAPRADTTVAVQVVPSIDGTPQAPRYLPGQAVSASQPAARLAAWRQGTPRVTTPDAGFAQLLADGVEDLGVLRITDPAHQDRVVVAAGAPWFMTLFGRDSLLTSWMLLPADPCVALGTLQTLADLQGETADPRTEEEPGRILHEVRSGLNTGLALSGRGVYYGSIDATPLFVMLLAELRRWGQPREAVDALLPHADRALDWVIHYGDRDGDGFVEYQRATDRGLVNQGWKDSFDGISFATGVLAEPPIALAEVQGYTYAAYASRAHLARDAGDEVTASGWAARAAELKRAFNEVFWLDDRGYFALALDAQKRPVDSLASNMGHCLWTGIVDEDKAGAVAAKLLSKEMFSGFGVRTLASNMGAYNPMSYHNGSVWPHDNALIAAGLMRYGFVEEAQRIALALLDAAELLGGRLPELFCGFDRAEFAAPVPYPTSCAPQAWAAAAPLLLLRSLLRFDPSVSTGRVWCDPVMPARLAPLRVERLNLAGCAVTVEVTPNGSSVAGLPAGVELICSPAPPAELLLGPK